MTKVSCFVGIKYRNHPQGNSSDDPVGILLHVYLLYIKIGLKEYH